MAADGDTCVEGSLEINAYLQNELNKFNQETELSRILQISEKTLNPFEIIGYPTELWARLEADEAVIRSFYREKCLLLHPDKCKLERASEGFELLKDAAQILSDAKKRSNLIEIVKEARDVVLKKKSFPQNGRDGSLQMSPEILSLIVLEVRNSLIQERKRIDLRIKNDFERKSAVATSKEIERKRKIEYEEEWEKNRELRVHNWREFVKTGGNKSRRRPSDKFDVIMRKP